MLSQNATIKTVEGHAYTPWTNGYAVGFRCVHPDGRVEYIYLNPSGQDDGGEAVVFVYVGPAGNPGEDPAEHFYPLFQEDT